MRKKVFVSGCFDLLHSGHVAFLQAAAAHGDLYVALGSDATVSALKGRAPLCKAPERLYMVRALACVKEAVLSGGSGMLDFADELRRIRPDLFVVNADGNLPQKERMCRELGIDYLVLTRQPSPGLPARSTTALRQGNAMPYRIDLAGGWLDQPSVSSLHAGAVLTISIEPTVDFSERSGMATSTRNHALELWGPHLPAGDAEKWARVLFRYDNPPGTRVVSGSQDAIGIVLPALNRLYYEGDYWPTRIEKVGDEATLQFLENSVALLPLGPRKDDYDPWRNCRLTREGAQELAEAADACWRAILARDLLAFGEHVRRSTEAQRRLFPNMVDDSVFDLLRRHRQVALGWKLSGAGGGGYLIVVCVKPMANAIRIRIRRA